MVSQRGTSCALSTSLCPLVLRTFFAISVLEWQCVLAQQSAMAWDAYPGPHRDVATKSSSLKFFPANKLTFEWQLLKFIFLWCRVALYGMVSCHNFCRTQTLPVPHTWKNDERHILSSVQDRHRLFAFPQPVSKYRPIHTGATNTVHNPPPPSSSPSPAPAPPSPEPARLP